MKIGRYRGTNGIERLGVAVNHGDELKVLDLQAAAHAHAQYPEFPATMDAFMAAGARALQEGYQVIE